MPYQLDQNLQEEQYETNSKASNYVQLPFDAPVIYWKHGDPDAAPGSMARFGRWNADVESYDQVCQALNIGVPSEIETRYEKENGKPTENTYQVYSWRNLIFSVVCSRSRWYTDRATGKSRSHIQTLVHLAEKKSNGLLPTFPAVLSAKVYASSELEKLIKQWFKFIVDQGVNIPPHYFYMAVGTFGDKSQFSGTHGTSTLPTLYLPPNPDPEKLPFVGNEIAKKMAEMKINALEWMNDPEWIEPSEVTSTSPNRNSRYDQPMRDMPDDDDSIPF